MEAPTAVTVKTLQGQRSWPAWVEVGLRTSRG